MIATLSARSGGVPAMTGFITACLRESGWEPVLAHYEPYSLSPRLSVPSYRLLQRSVGSERRETFGSESHAIGAWLPELEFMNYSPHGHWRRVMESCDRHIVVSGNALAAMPLLATGRPFLAWIATGWHEDRADRVRTFPWTRRILDRLVNTPIQRRLERRILKSGHILALSRHTRRVLDGLAGAEVARGILPMPIDADLFQPDESAVVPGRIGFSARMNDPRKNVRLLLAAAQRLVARGHNISVDLIGELPDRELEGEVARLDLQSHVRFADYMPKDRLAHRLQSLDVYVIPSRQEGLCIAGLEAMCCGCPVVSTRCGGPEEFVVDDVTGALVGFDPAEMAAAIEGVVTDRGRRMRLSQNARQMILDVYGRDAAVATFFEHFNRTFGAVRRVAA